MIRLIYQNIPRGKTLFGKCMDKFFLSAIESEAVRNRAFYLEKKIKTFLKKKPNSKIVFFGCGIAKEIQNLIFSSPHIIKEAEIYLIDQDIEALKVAQYKLESILRKKNIKLHIQFYNWGVKNILRNGFSFGNVDLIYSAGVYDYFPDKVCTKLTQKFYSLLNPDGKIIIGNFNVDTPEYLVRTIILDWNLIQRDEKTLKSIFSTIGKIKIEREPLNINLFVIISKKNN